jgi:hypothetical protein
MVRLGLADGHSSSIYSSPKYGANQSWTMKPASELTSLHKRVVALLKQKPYGPFKATVLMLGSEAASRLGKDSTRGCAQYVCPSTTASTIPAKREVIVIDDDDLHPTLLSPPSPKKIRRK